MSILGEDEAWLSTQNARRLESSRPLLQNLRNYEKKLVEEALSESNGKVAGPTGASGKHGIPWSSLDFKIKHLNIKRYPFR